MAAGLAVLFDAVREGNTRLDAGENVGPLIAAYDEIVGVLGIGEPGAVTSDGEGTVESIEELVQSRARARAAGDYAAADAIRDQLAALGITIEDTADGSRWYRA